MPGKSGNDQKAFYRYDLFISYASEDFEQARKLVTRLQQDGYRVWFDKTEMPGTGQVSGNLGQAVDDSRQFIICLSDTYCRKDYTQYELQIIFSKDPANSRNTRIVTQIAASLPEKIPDSISFVPRLDLSRQENYEQEY
ncbi:MAG TPA: toll/interleukin-1 receptor domain-containing protein, partial [Treponemataceae bacterium]|nr:toll/interleukin-1 receptor domain-containing protein [Treponemataceae bacterium]